MDVVVTTDQRLYCTPDGAIWTPLLPDFWARYRRAFDGVTVVARVFDAPHPQARWGRLSGERVSVAALPGFDGVASLAAAYGEVRRRIAPLATGDEAVLLRLPSVFAGRIGRRLARAGKPFGAEIVGDSGEVLARGSFRHPARPFLRRLAVVDQRRLCRQACATAYVTERTLQARFPPGAGRFTTHYSDVDLGDEDFVAAPRATGRRSVASLLHVGTFSQPYKGQDTLVRAAALLRQRGVDLRLTLVGDGRYRAEVEARVRLLGLDAAVEFAGEISDRPVLRQRLDAADVFVFPSRTEGLPRALIEAMARAVPCIATPVGGIPELLPPEALCPAGDAPALAAKIAEALADPERLERMSAANLATSRRYHRALLEPRGAEFLARLGEATAAWLGRKSR